MKPFSKLMLVTAMFFGFNSLSLAACSGSLTSKAPTCQTGTPVKCTRDFTMGAAAATGFPPQFEACQQTIQIACPSSNQRMDDITKDSLVFPITGPGASLVSQSPGGSSKNVVLKNEDKLYRKVEGTISYVCNAITPAPAPVDNTAAEAQNKALMQKASIADSNARKVVRQINRRPGVRGNLINPRATQYSDIKSGYIFITYTLKCDIPRKRSLPSFNLKVDIAKGTLTNKDTGQGVVAAIKKMCNK